MHHCRNGESFGDCFGDSCVVYCVSLQSHQEGE